MHSVYYACGLDAYPSSGRYNAGYQTDSYCNAVFPSVPNKTLYRTLPGPDVTFSICGIGCPSGYTVTGYSASSGCSLTGTTPTEKNSTSCRKLTAKTWSWNICGTDTDVCPSGYTVGTRSHTTLCEKPGDPATGNNTITCNPIP